MNNLSITKIMTAASFMAVPILNAPIAFAQDHEALMNSCEQGNASVCRQLGQEYQTNYPDWAAYFYGQGCKVQDAASCYILGQAYEIGNGVPQDIERAASLYFQTCEAGNDQACSSFSVLQSSGTAGYYNNVQPNTLKYSGQSDSVSSAEKKSVCEKQMDDYLNNRIGAEDIKDPKCRERLKQKLLAEREEQRARARRLDEQEAARQRAAEQKEVEARVRQKAEQKRLEAERSRKAEEARRKSESAGTSYPQGTEVVIAKCPNGSVPILGQC